MSEIDEINTQIDKRKISKLVEDNVISPEELATAEIWIECPSCRHEEIIDETQHIDEYICNNCGEHI